MPIYEYVCDQCGKLNDVLQKVSDPPPAQCNACGAKGKLTKIVSRSSFVLAGGGWYSDLYSSTKKDSDKKDSDKKDSDKKDSDKSSKESEKSADTAAQKPMPKDAGKKAEVSSPPASPAKSETPASPPAKPARPKK